MSNNFLKLVKLSTQTASASASLIFTSFITTNFTSYYIQLRNIVPATNAQAIILTFSTDNGSTYLSTNYKYCVKWSLSSGATSQSASDSASSIILTHSLSSTAARAYNGNLFLFAVDQGVLVPQFYGYGASRDGSGNASTQICSGMNTSTAGINSLKFTMASGNITSGDITLYGVKDN